MKISIDKNRTWTTCIGIAGDPWAACTITDHNGMERYKGLLRATPDHLAIALAEIDRLRAYRERLIELNESLEDKIDTARECLERES